MYVKVPKSKITKMKIIKTDCKLSLSQVIAQQKCDYAINGGLYDMKTGKVSPIPLRIDGKTIATSKDGYWMMAWNTGPDICMIHSKDMEKWKNAIACSTMLKDGKETIFTYTPAQGGFRGRTAIGNDKDNLHLFVTTDKNGPLFPTSLRNKMKAAGCQNAIMLDCGGSSQMYALGKYYQAEKRKVSYWICVWLEDTLIDNSSIPICPYKEPTALIKQGTRGESAKWVQWYLWKLKFLKSEKDIDGNFGPQSVVALKAFQKTVFAKKEDWDGVCGSATRAELKKKVK